MWVRKGGKILMQRRAGIAPSPGTWCPPGGHLEMWEAWEECGRRQVREEAGIEIGQPRLVAATNDFFKKDGKHYITLHLVADWVSGEARIMEPDKCDACKWFAWHELPEPLSLFTSNFVTAGYNPFNI